MHSELIILAYNSYSLPYHFLPESVCIVWVLKSQEILHTSLLIWVRTHQEASNEGPSVIEPWPSLNVARNLTYGIIKKWCWNLSKLSDSNFCTCTHDHTVKLYARVLFMWIMQIKCQSHKIFNAWNVKQHIINKTKSCEYLLKGRFWQICVIFSHAYYCSSMVLLTAQCRGHEVAGLHDPRTSNFFKRTWWKAKARGLTLEFGAVWCIPRATSHLKI